MALTESNTNEEQNVTFATGNGKLLFYNCLLHRVQFILKWKRCIYH